MLDTARFNELCRPFVETLFDAARRLSASPAPRTGVTRLGYSDEEEAVVLHLEELGRSLVLETERDAAQNLWMTLPGEDRTLPAIVSGSHADSVLDGGNYDGFAGIAAALCPILWLKENHVTLKRDYRVLVIRCEEQGLVGTTAMLGKLKPEDLKRRFTTDGPTLEERLANRGINPEPFTAGKPLFDTNRIAAFFETHIEQSLKLDRSTDKRVGIVTGIRGLRVHRRIRCTGETAHAGAVDYPFRHDAAAACARFVAIVYDRWQHYLAMGHDLVVTTGSIATPDTAIFNKISGLCDMSLDMRTLSEATFEAFSREIDETLVFLEKDMRVKFTADPAIIVPPNHSDAVLVAKLEASAASLGIGCQKMASGAGHDAANFGAAGIPFAMIFIANQNGSHNPNEAMKTDDFLEAAAVLTQSVVNFD